MSDDLLVWLREQLDEDERLARAASAGPWLDPARVLREVEAKRRILDDCESSMRWADHLRAGTGRETAESEATARHAGSLLGVLRILALPYSDRPGYRQEWVP